MYIRKLVLRALAAVCVLASIAPAQIHRAAIFGTVTDTSGAFIPGAGVTVTNTGTGFVFRSQTNEAGFYSAPDLAVGGYQVQVEKDGFKKVVRSGILLQVNQRAQVDLALEIGAVAESVEVVGQASLVDTGSATTGKVIENRRIQDLPVNGRNAMSLVVLTPSVKSNAGTTNAGFADRGPRLSALSINGGVNGQNGILLDGANNVHAYQGEVNVNIAVEAVQEFKVQTGTMSSEFGFTSGGVINIVTKSGTNQIHGSLYEYFRNDKLDARNAFASTKGPLRFNQYGAAVGGPVIRDRTFYFGHWEGFRYIKTDPGVGSFPTRDMQAGDFSNLRGASGALIPIYNPYTTRANPSGTGFIRDPFAGNVIPNNLLDPVALNFTKTFIPAPNRTPSNPFTTSNNYGRNGATTRNMTQYTMKGDHKISDRNTMFARYSFFKWNTNLGGGGVWPDAVMNQVKVWDVVNRSAIIADTHVFSPTLINEFRISLARGTFPFKVASAGEGWPQKLGFPSNVPPDVMPRFNAGLPGYFTGTDGLRTHTGWVFANTLTKITGSHTLKFGVDHRINRGNAILKLSPSGDFTFNAALTGNPQSQAGTGDQYATFILGAVSSGLVTTHLGESIHGFTTTGFVQDDWKVSGRLTLNLGLRYDYQQQPINRWNGNSNFDPFTIDSVSGLMGRTVYAGVDGQRRSFRDQDYTDFGPRFGFAYDLTGRGKTVVRGGYAIFYPSIWYRDNYGQTNGFANTFTNYDPPGGNTNFPAFQLKDGFPSPPRQPLGPALGPSAFLGQAVTWDETYGSTAYSQQWTASLQQQLPGSWVVDLSYSANKGTHNSSGDEVGGGYDFNQLDPQYLSLGQDLFTLVPNPYAGRVPGALGAPTIARQQLLRPYPYYSRITVRTPHSSGYTAHYILFSAERRMSKGLALLFSYTAGKIVSENLSSPINFDAIEQADVVTYQNGKFNRRAERAVDPSDISQRGVLSLVYDLPFGRGQRWSSSSGVVNQIVGGWQLNTIGVMQTGYPVIVRGASNFLADRPNSTGTSPKVDNRTTARWFDTTQFVNPANFTFGNLGRVLPDVRNPGTNSWDVSAIKNTQITERVTLQFRFESFNLLNNVNLGGVNGGFSPGPDGKNISGAFGVITGSRDARNQQIALKLLF